MSISPFLHSEYDVGFPKKGLNEPNPVKDGDYEVPSA